MAIYLAEHQIGFDPAEIGYPALGGCMAVALLSDQGIYGFHFTPGKIEQVEEFARHIAGLARGDNPLKLYGSCNFANRYNGGDGKTQWKAEMTAIAGKLGFSGPVRGFNISNSGHTDPQGPAYCEYRRENGKDKLRIFYKRQSKMSIDSRVMAPNAAIQRIKPTGNIGPGAYTSIVPTDKKNIHSISIISTKGNKGELHEAGTFQKHSFDV